MCEDKRTDEEKETALSVANALRSLADTIEGSIVRDIKIDQQNGVLTESFEHSIQHYPNGECRLEINLGLYDGAKDRRSEYFNDLANKKS